MDHPKNETMNVLVTVAFPPFETRSSEEAWEEDIVKAVSAAVHADKTLDFLSVRPLEYEDCQWVFESGMPMPDYGVTVPRTDHGVRARIPLPRRWRPAGMTCSPCSITWWRRGW